MVTEIRLIGITLSFARIANEWEISSGLGKRLSLIGRPSP